jgi:hypothetical protein
LGGEFRLSNVLWNQEDCAPNPAHFLLVLLAAISLSTRIRRNLAPAVYALAVALGFVGFCAYLRWQPWHTRLHLPLMVLAAPFVGAVVAQNWQPRLAMVLAGLLPLLAIPVIAENYNHPLVGYPSIFDQKRSSRYFVTRPGMEAPYRQIIDAVVAHHPREVGLIIGGNDWEYPFDMLLKRRLPNIRIEAYPNPLVWQAGQLHTRNKGWDENLRPYVVVRIDEETGQCVKFVDDDPSATSR